MRRQRHRPNRTYRANGSNCNDERCGRDPCADAHRGPHGGSTRDSGGNNGFDGGSGTNSGTNDERGGNDRSDERSSRER